MNNLQKYFSGMEGLHAHDFFKNTGIIADLRSGTVFAAIRKEELHFYYSGARLCAYRTGRSPAKGVMRTNNRYIGITGPGKSRDVTIPPEWCSREKYKELKQNCCKRRPGESELKIVSQLFREFSFSASGLPPERTRLLDIEIRFPGAVGPTKTQEKTQDMIDCLFITPRGTLVFVEVKRSSNGEARNNGSGVPAVANQLKSYKRQLTSDEKMVEHIKEVYAGVNATLSTIFGDSPQPRTIKDVFRGVPLLIVGKAAAHSEASKETWQRDLLATPFVLDSEIIGVDGRGEGMNDALHELFRAVDSYR